MSDNIKILRNYILYFLTFFIVCIVGVSGVFADTYNNIGYLDDYSYVDVHVGYTSQILPLQRTNTYQLADVLELYIEVSGYNFSGGTSYSLEFFTPNTTLYTSNSFSVLGTTSSNEPITCDTAGIGFTDTHYLNFKFNCSKSVNNIKINIFNSAGGYIMDNGIFAWNYIYLRELVSGTDTSILESQNAQIIQGQQDIINNQNENTEKQIESQKVCQTIYSKNVPLQKGFLQSDGSIFEVSSGFGYSDFIQVEQLNVVFAGYGGAIYTCFYNKNKVKLQCISNENFDIGIYNLPNDTYYMRFSYMESNQRPQYEITSCQNGNQALNDSITGLNDSLNDADTDGATSEASDFFSSFTTNTFGLTSIITAPLNLIQSLTTSSCSELHLPLPYLNNKYLDLPCMTSIYQTHFGAFFTMYQTITYGIIAYWVCVRIFNQVKDFKNPEHDEIEVVDL